MNKSCVSQARRPLAEQGHSLRLRAGHVVASIVAGVVVALGIGCSYFRSGEAPPPPPEGAPGVDGVKQGQKEPVDKVLARISSLEAKSEFSEALELLNRLLVDHPDLVEGEAERRERLRSVLRHLEAAESHRSAGRDLAAEQELEEAAALFPQLNQQRNSGSTSHEGVLKPLLIDARAARESQDDQKLLEVYQKIREVRPLQSAEWLHSGQAQENLDDTDAARESYESIVPEAPEYVEARTRLARIARDEGDLPRAKVELERARSAAPDNLEVVTRYTEICSLLDDLDAAIAAWRDVSRLQPQNPDPLESIGDIEERREQWEKAGDAYLECLEKTSEPRLDLLLKLATTYGRVGKEEQILETYLNVIEGLEIQSDPSSSGEVLKRELLDQLRELGFVHRRGTWINPAERYSENGWVRSGQQWIRPEEARLRSLVERLESQSEAELRTLDDADYRTAAKDSRLLKGMNRREIVAAWGFFDDQNVYRLPDSDVVYEQLLYKNGRQIYLRNGLVCDWSN